MKIREELEALRTKINTDDVDLFKSTVSYLYEKYPTETDTITAFVESIVLPKSDQLTVDIKNLCLKVQLKDYDEIIPYSYIAKHYFKKSRSWLSQRINGYDGNGKPIEFNKTELEIFEKALQEISKKLGSITLT